MDPLALPSLPEAAAPTLARVARLAVTTFKVPFAQVVCFGDVGGGVQPVSHGTLGGTMPDLRLACSSLPPDASLVVIEDGAKDARLVLPGDARFFAYAHAEDADGTLLGGLCLLDDTPRQLVAAETDALTDLAALAADALIHGGHLTAKNDAEARFRALSEAVFDALFIVDDGVILDANDAAAELLGFESADTFIGRPLLDFIAKDSAETLAAQMATPGRYPAAFICADESICLAEVSATLFPHDGRSLRVTAVRRVEEES